MKNKNATRSRILEVKIREIMRLFAVDLDDLQIAQIAGVHRNAVNRYLAAFRERIAHFCEAESSVKGEVEVDELLRRSPCQRPSRSWSQRKDYFGGLFKRNGRVYTEVVPDCSKATLQGRIRGRVDLESIIDSDGWRGYDGLVDLGYQTHFRVQHGSNEFANKHSHINGIESFWAFAKTRIVRFRGLAKHTFYFHLRGCEFLFNRRSEDIYKLVLKMLKEKPLS